MTLVDATFGDCDPAGIVFYPNIFRWLDRSFHEWLRPHGGHAEICHVLGAIGIGLIDVSAQFKRPIHDGDRVEIFLNGVDWGRKSLTIGYEGSIGGGAAFKASEVRGLFKRENGAIFASEIAALKELVEAIGKK